MNTMENVKFISIIWLFPLVFMFHDFEEIIFMQWWEGKNKLVLIKKYPWISEIINSNLCTAAFSLAVSEEFIILGLITLTSVIYKWYYLWLGALITFFVHLIMHLIQWIVFKKYIPAIATAIPSMMYSAYAVYYIYNSCKLEILPLTIWSILSMILFIINLIFVRKLAGKFNKFINSSIRAE